MFLQADQVERDLEADVCIVGSGPAGITIANELAPSGLSILVVESGGFELEADTQNLYRAEQRGIETDSAEINRLRVFGGTSGHWGGRCLRLEEIDFAERDWVPGSGWPVGAADLEPFYLRALEIVGIRDGALRRVEEFEAPLAGQGRLAGPVLENFVVRISQPPMRFGIRFRESMRLATNVTVLLRANATEVVSNEDASRATGIRVQTLAGKRFDVRSRRTVLATGAIENARLLLNSTSRATRGLGNEHGLVGRYFMQHPHVLLSRLLSPGIRSNRLGRSSNRPDASIATRFTPEIQRREKLLNSYFLLWDHSRVEADGFVEVSREAFRQLRGIYSEADLERDLGFYLEASEQVRGAATGSSVESGHALTLVAERPEQAPNPQSRIRLSSERDALGMRRAILDWQLTDLDRHTFERCRTLLAGEVGRLGIGRLRDWPVGVDPTREGGGFLHGGHHHMGTTRMHADPRRGVVGPDAQVHGVADLYVAGGSVFPTSGFANPTLTLIALSVRLADMLKETFH